MILIKMPELLLIAGTGRNSGKTTIVCNIIKKSSPNFQVVAIKVTPHFHQNIESGKIVFDRNDLVIIEELDSETGKDSSLMLKAGAVKSYFVMAKDDQLEEAMQLIIKQIPDKTPVICESGGLRHWFEPGLFLMMNRSDNVTFKPGVEDLKSVADHWITFDGKKLDFDVNTINYSGNKWSILKEK
ncbi:MAG: hypothetical protein GZ094_05615 [Mariniphaga sp.]|nr:hypothetical protein [Mariniphaga sp.]